MARSSGLATGHPDAAGRPVRALLDNEGSRSFAACPEVGALTALFEECTVADGDLIAIRQQLRRLCPGAPAELEGWSPSEWRQAPSTGVGRNSFFQATRAGDDDCKCSGQCASVTSRAHAAFFFSS